MTKYIKDCTRCLTEDQIESWKKGEKYFEEMFGVEYSSKFERDGKMVTVFYEEEQGNLAHEAIKVRLNEEGFFDKLCEDFAELIRQKHEIQARMMPALRVFDEIDNYPEIANADIHRRLMRIRTSTHEESYV